MVLVLNMDSEKYCEHQTRRAKRQLFYTNMVSAKNILPKKVCKLQKIKFATKQNFFTQTLFAHLYLFASLHQTFLYLKYLRNWL